PGCGGSRLTGWNRARGWSRLTSRPFWGRLISRWISATASNACSMAWSRLSRGAPPAVTSTKAPSSGRARRTLPEAGFIERQDSLHAFGDVLRRERRAGDVPDVLVDGDGIPAGLAVELMQPVVAGDLAPVRLAVLENLDGLDPAVRREGHAVVDDQMLADHVVDDEESGEAPRDERLPHLLAARADVLAGEPL